MDLTMLSEHDLPPAPDGKIRWPWRSVGSSYSVFPASILPVPKIVVVTPTLNQSKYLEETTQYICPCGLSAEEEKSIAELALTAFNLLGARGWGRVDLIVDSNGTAWLIELNTVPGMTGHSLVPMAAKQAGIEFDDLVLKILDSSMEKISHKRRLCA